MLSDSDTETISEIKFLFNTIFEVDSDCPNNSLLNANSSLTTASEEASPITSESPFMESAALAEDISSPPISPTREYTATGEDSDIAKGSTLEDIAV